jgi:RNA polymerase-binding protein DksA
MSPEKQNRFRSILLDMRVRVGGEVNHVVQSIQDEVNVNENLSNAPVHLADVAVESVDADVQVLQAERSMLDDINGALQRIQEGTFGECLGCGTAIAEERLKAIPFTPLCIECARNGVDLVS